MEIKIRNATLSDLPSLLDFARSVGRFLGADEIETWMQIDPEAMFVAETPPNGKLIGSCCGTRLTPQLGFIGLYMVLKEYRGKGIGLKLWRAAKEHLGDRNIGVHGDPINFKKYTEKEGFDHVEDYAILYYDCFGFSGIKNVVPSSDIEVATYFEGRLIGFGKKYNRNASLTEEKVAADNRLDATCAERNVTKGSECFEKSSLLIERFNKDKLSGVEDVDESLPSNVAIEDRFLDKEHDGLANVGHGTKSNIVMNKSSNEFQNIPNAVENPKAEEILAGVLAFDESLHNRDRSFLVKQTFFWSSCRSKVALLGDKVVGYACLRSAVTEHWIISPFYAETEDVARILMFELLQEFDFSKALKGIQIRFPDKNIACKRLVEKFGFRDLAFSIMTGFTKRCINIDTSKVYSFHSTVFCSE